MNEQTNYEQKVAAELDKIKARVDLMKAEAKGAAAEQRTKFDNYLAALEERTEKVEEDIKSMGESGEAAKKDIEEGLSDAKDRLAIAVKAAQARFNGAS